MLCYIRYHVTAAKWLMIRKKETKKHSFRTFSPLVVWRFFTLQYSSQTANPSIPNRPVFSTCKALDQTYQHALSIIKGGIRLREPVANLPRGHKAKSAPQGVRVGKIERRIPDFKIIVLRDENSQIAWPQLTPYCVRSSGFKVKRVAQQKLIK